METHNYWEETSASSQNVKFESQLFMNENRMKNPAARQPREWFHSCGRQLRMILHPQESCGSADGSSRRDDQSIFQFCEGNLNFTTAAGTSEDDEFNYHKKKVSRDPMSHRIIEKRRRDRMNNCLADLSRLIPADYLKKGRGRIEKTEIIEMAIKHMKHLQTLACPQLDTFELVPETHQPGPIVLEHYRLGYQECLSEAMHFMVEVEGYYAGDPLCVQLISHLQKHCDKILKGDRLNFPRTHLGDSTSSSSSNSYGHRSHAVGGSSGLGSSSSPSLGSGSGSDSGAKDTKLEVHPPVAGVPDVIADNREELRGSQLRDMLQQQPPLTTFTSPITTSPQDLGNTPSLYKFKNNIKQRFSAEQDDIIDSPAVNIYSGAKRPRYASEASEDAGGGTTNILGLNVDGKRQDSETCSVPSSPPSPKYNTLASPATDLSSRVTPPPHPRHKTQSVPSQGVPIFALHAKGSFYIPLTLEADVLAPYLSAIGIGTDIDVSHNTSPKSVVLHPVTISVNFQQVNRQVKVQHMSTFSSNLPWKSESNGFSSVAKWPVCVQDRG